MDNRSNLLQCAKELFYAKGYDAVGVQEIVDRAGLTKPSPSFRAKGCRVKLVSDDLFSFSKTTSILSGYLQIKEDSSVNK